MSWDVAVFNLQDKPRTLDDLREEMILPFGPAARVREGISAVLPDVDWSDPTWGIYGGEGFSIEFNVGKDDPIQNMMLHVRGGGDAVADIMKLVVANGWIALDCTTSEFLDPAAPSSEGWIAFQRYREQIVKR